MTTRRRHLLTSSAALLAAPGLAIPSLAVEGFPSRPVSLVVPFPPGGTTDLGGRIIAPRAAHHLGGTIVIENRPGAAGAVAADQVRRADPDGHTLFLGVAATHGVRPAVFGDQLPYDAVADFAPVALLGVTPFLLVVRADSPFQTAAQLIERLRAEPGRHNYASAGPGGVPHLAGEWLRMEAGVDVVHVPYRGGAQMLQGLLSGDVTFMIESVPTVAAAVADGRLRVLARATTRPGGAFAEVPTLGALGMGDVDAETWIMAIAPAGTPAAVLARLNAAFNAANAEPAVVEQLAAIGTQAISDSTPESAAAHIREEIARWRGVVERAGIRLSLS